MRLHVLFPLQLLLFTGMLLTGMLLFGACSSDSDGSAADEAASQATAASCIASYAERPCDLLTEAMVREHLPAPPDSLAQEDVGAMLAERGMSSNIAGVAMNGCVYSWDGGRTMNREDVLDTGEGEEDGSGAYREAFRGMLQNIPVDNTVALRAIQVLEADDPRARFEQRWRAPTAEERDALAERMGEAMDEAREEGRVSDQGAEMGREMGEGLAQAEIAFETVADVGTAARWGGMGDAPALKVLDGATEFEVSVDITDDDAANRDVAIALARALLATCTD